MGPLGAGGGPGSLAGITKTCLHPDPPPSPGFPNLPLQLTFTQKMANKITFFIINFAVVNLKVYNGIFHWHIIALANQSSGKAG